MDHLRAAGAGGKGMDGVLRLYNIGHETRYRPGGDKETSYVYELGFPREYFADAPQWAEAIKCEAQELFHVAAKAIGRWVDEFVEKAQFMGRRATAA